MSDKDFAKVKENADLRKNVRTGAVINTNKANYMARKAKKYREKKQQEEMDTMKNEIQELKELIKALTNGNN